MAGEIKHEWNGTVLTITSDSGTSSMDLQGKKGDTGIRGPQGRAGVILKDDGTVDMNGYATEAYVIDAIEVALEDYTPSGGGTGGGGSTNNAEMKLKSTTGWTYKTIADSGTCVITAEWSSIEDEMETGGGTLTLYVNNTIKANKNIPQGPFGIDVTQYLNSGNNTVTIKVTDIYGNSGRLAYTVNKQSLIITSTFDSSVAYSDDVSFTYTATGSGSKTVHFILDGEEIGTQTVTTSGRQSTFTIPMQEHGSHLLEVYFTVVLDEEDVPSNHLFYDLMFVTSGVDTPIISCAYQTFDVVQFETITIEYNVYTPSALTSTVVLKEGDDVVSELVVDRKTQVWSYRADTFGEVVLTISCGDIVKTIKLNVTETPIHVTPVTDSLELYLTSYGRSNSETDPAHWEYEDIACTFSGYNWVSDGWQTDEDGITVHRVGGDARLTIPLQIFKNDFRTTGKTIELEFRTREVLDYNSEIISCYSGDVGFKVTAQEAMLKSMQSKIGTQYKEDEHIRLSFVIEKKADNRLLYCYLNGIMCGCTQYPTDDDFSQISPVNITIGSNLCTTDIYCIRVYKNGLNHYQILDNWIFDTQDIALKADRYNRNNVFDDYGEIVIDNLPANLPYIILRGETLPQYKGHVVSLDGEFVNPANPKQSFTFTAAECGVQGTSSAGYARKNFKINFINGITQNGVLKDTYQMRDNSIPASVFCFKADVASSEGANNVLLARQYNDVCPYKTPMQKKNSSYRQGIDGFPMVIFHDDGNTVKFVGKYNFNDEKSSHDVYGFRYGDESWELKNNTSDRVIWKSADFSTTDWQNDFEARYPEDNTNINNLRLFAEWVVSTDRTTATNATLTSPVTIEGVTYEADTADYRLARFRAEIRDYCELESAIFFYLFSTLYMLVDNRAKNTFPSIISGSKIVWLPYDMDSAMGISNTGELSFGFALEDTDTLPSGAQPFNGQDSVFWTNIRDAFSTEIQSMYKGLRSSNKISYEITEKSFSDHQGVYPEAIWNMDAWYKYIQPLVDDGAGIYLPMLHGSKAEQRKWWLYNRFRYIDSKYNAGDALNDFITLRGYAKSDITVTPYADIYPSVKYGSYLVQDRGTKDVPTTLACPLDNVNDTEIYIYSASQLKDVGDLSGLKVGLADFSMATHLQHIKLGDSASTYSNTNLDALTLGNNTLLKTLDARNCAALGTGDQQSLDLSSCTNIEEVYLTGTALKSVTLPDGGSLKVLHLPDTITNLSVCNQTSLAEFVLNDPSNITTLRLEHIDDVISAQRIVDHMADGGRVRIINANMTLTGLTLATAFFEKLDTMRGLDENGNNVNTAQISGHFRVTSDCEPYIAEWQEKYPNITFEIWTPTLEGVSWKQISELGELGLLSEFFSVGDEKTITLYTGEVVTAVILGFNHDYINSSSTNTIMAPVTFGLKDCLATTSTAGLTYAGYGSSGIKKVIDSYFDLLPVDLQNAIAPVQKSYRYYSENSWTGVWSSNSSSPSLKLWAFSTMEVMGTQWQSVGQSERGSDTLGKQYQYFKESPIPEGMTPLTEGETTGTYYDNTATTKIYYNQRAIKQLGNDSVQDIAYRLRSITQRTVGNAVTPDSYGCYVVATGNRSYTSSTSSSFGVTFGFCL